METGINWKAVPFVRLLAPLLAGIAAGNALPSAPLYLVLAGFCLLGFLHRLREYRWRYLFGSLLMLQLALCGIWLIQQTQVAQQPLHFSHAEPSVWRAYAVRVMGTSERFRRIELRVLARLDSTGNWQSAEGRLLAYFPVQASDSIVAGRLLEVQSKPRPVEGPVNPNGFDYRAYLAGKGIHHQCFLREGDWQLQGMQPGFMLRIRRWQQHLLQILGQRLEAEHTFPVAAAMVLGSRDALSAELRDAYTRTGALHVLAVSGLHVGLVYLFLLGFWKLLPWKSRWRDALQTISCLAGIWLFALLTGGAPSVMRASVLFSFLLIGSGLGRKGNIYNSLAASAFCLLWIDPNWAFDIGFQLSYTAVAGIVFFQPRIHKLLVVPKGLPDYAWRLMAVSLAAQLGTLPVSLYYFHQFPMYFWLSGLVVVPAAPIILGGGLILILLELLNPGWGFLPAWLLNQLTPWINKSLYAMQHWPYSVWEGIWIPAHWVLVAYAALLSLAFLLEFRRRRSLVILLLCLIALSADRIRIRWQQAHQQDVVEYQFRNDVLLDCITGRQALVLYHLDSLPRDAVAHRQAIGVQKLRFQALPEHGWVEIRGMGKPRWLRCGHPPPDQQPEGFQEAEQSTSFQ